MKVDGAYAAVRFPSTRESKDGKDVKEEDSVSVLQDCRLMRVEDLQVLKSVNTSRAPDCFQKTPKRCNMPEGGQLMTLTVDMQGMYEFFSLFFRLLVPVISTNCWLLIFFNNYC